MQTFKFNNVNIRFFESGDNAHFITSDANLAFGFGGQNTRLDKLSKRLDSLAKDTDHILSTENLAKNTLTITLPELIKGVIKSGNPDIENLGDIFVQMAARDFMAARTPKDRPMLPAVSDDARLNRLAEISADSRFRTKGSKLPKAGDEYWLSITNVLVKYGLDRDDSDCVINDGGFRFWLNNRMGDAYRNLYGTEPPKAKDKEGKSQGASLYPPEMHPIIWGYAQSWLARESQVFDSTARRKTALPKPIPPLLLLMEYLPQAQ